MAGHLSPFVYWGQSNEKIFLKVDLNDVQKPEVNLQEDGLQFRAVGHGLMGLNQYSFTLQFYLPIDPEHSHFRTTDRHIEFKLQKVGEGEVWPRLIVQQKKPPWLKIDFDHFAFEDDSDDNANQDLLSTQEEDLIRNLEKDLEGSETKTFGDIKTFYLFVYNMFQWVGYSYVFFNIFLRYWMYGQSSKMDVFENLAPQIMVCQLAAFLEIVHPMLGWVKSGVLMPLMQVLGRNMILFMLITQEPQLQNREIIWWLFGTWSLIEVVRYPFYMLSIVKMEWSLVTWLRYSIWIPLYPLGFTMEGIVMLLALPYFELSGRWNIELPNTWNFAFRFTTFLRIYMIGFLFAMYLLMKRMYEQRKIKIRPTSGTRKLKTKMKKA